MLALLKISKSNLPTIPFFYFQRWRTVLSFSKTTDIVPLALVLTRPPNWNKNWKNSSAYSFGEAHVPSKHSIYERDPEDFKLYGGTYKYGQRVYVAKLWPHFKVNSDVAWTPENGSQPFIGKVKYIGEYESSEGYPVIEAIVQFVSLTKKPCPFIHLLRDSIFLCLMKAIFFALGSTNHTSSRIHFQTTSKSQSGTCV